MNFLRKTVLTFFLSFIVCSAWAQKYKVNYDEKKVAPYQLPELLMTAQGDTIRTTEDWEQKRRPELLALFEQEMFGRAPVSFGKLRYKILSRKRDAVAGKATRKEVAIYFSEGSDEHMVLLLYTPNHRKKSPVFLGLNFHGNHTISDEEDILLTETWVRNVNGITDNKATADNRGLLKKRWPIELIIDNGYGVATIYSGDIDPDVDDGFQNGVHPLFYEAGQSAPAEDEWGTIAAWSKGLSRAMDYLAVDKNVDAGAVAVLGHSRLGKAALWAGAMDQRFALVISNNSGCGGAALSRRKFGETVDIINTAFPHWFCGNFKKYSHNEDKLPFDQHQLIALVAPRPVYIASAKEDRWADPRGEFLSGLFASPAYTLYQQTGMPATEMPKANEPLLTGHIGYHIRTGKHDLNIYDWVQYINFFGQHLRR